jgi:hypothetical protein
VPSLSPSSAPTIEKAELSITEYGQLKLFGSLDFITLSYDNEIAMFSFLEFKRKGLVLSILNYSIGSPVNLETKISGDERQK